MELIVLIALIACTRFAFRSHYLYDIDSVNFALALDRFDPSAHQPHPPGYFLYICLGRLSRVLFHDANLALVVVSIVFSCGAGALIYMFANNWFGRKAALFAGLIFLLSPLAWFHGTVALTYIVEAFFSALTGYLCWLIRNGRTRLIVPAAIVVGIAAGFRPSSLMLLFPLLAFSLLRSSRRQAWLGILTLGLSLLAWLIPMTQIAGGGSYLSALGSLWRVAPSKATVFNSSPLNSVARAGVIAFSYFLTFGCAAFLPFRRDLSADRPKTVFTMVWIGPGLLFFTFVFLRFVNSGYLLALSPPICVWLGFRASKWYAGLALPDIGKISLLVAGAAVNMMILIYAPVYCSYGEVRRLERELESLLRVLPGIAAPGDTVIVGYDSHFLGYRHAGYYLPRYTTIQFPEVQLAAGKRAFVMRDRDTRVESRLPLQGRRFVVFPLPSGDEEYRLYAEGVRRRFAPGRVRIVSSSGIEFTTGNAADLGVLFPTVMPMAGVAGK